MIKGWSNFSKISLSTMKKRKLTQTLRQFVQPKWLTSDSSDLIGLNQQLFEHRLHSISLLSLLVLHQVHFTVCAPSNRPQNIEVRLLDCRPLWGCLLASSYFNNTNRLNQVSLSLPSLVAEYRLAALSHCTAPYSWFRTISQSRDGTLGNTMASKKLWETRSPCGLTSE